MLKVIKKRFQKELNQFYNFYFGKKPKSKISIVVGDIFILGQGEKEKDPFKRVKERKNPSEVKVLDIREGYVQYEHLRGDFFNPDSMKLDTFLYVYRKKKVKVQDH